MGNAILRRQQLLSAAKAGDADKITLILDEMKTNKADVRTALNDDYVENRTPLMCSARGGFKACVELLVKSGSAVNKLDDWGHSALWHAVEQNRLIVVQYLVTDAHASLECKYMKKDVMTEQINLIEKEPPLFKVGMGPLDRKIRLIFAIRDTQLHPRMPTHCAVPRGRRASAGTLKSSACW